ncbi:MAG: YggS family pyridoxal phosphate-dependent enzyme [Thermodesulfobacteriota bacterium]|jgi:pyridoxal phosphate enzyme (YggS family)|nr:MAG: YggS family pyridoxal phosphate-dependent enzyme [Thermodesulfobacteriota bacterium]
METIAENITRLRERIYNRALKTGRKPDEITLVAVTKTVDSNRIKEAREAGVTVFGENYVQEAMGKIRHIGEEVSWHMIGHLQTNKVKHVVPLFSMIHSVDSVRLAEEISERAIERDKIMEVLIQVNIGRENAKAGGVKPEELPQLFEAVSSLRGINVKGLMIMPPYFSDPEKARPFFTTLRELRDKLFPFYSDSLPLSHLSMGMSSDFEVAIDEGATILRIGTAIFGGRK